MQRKAGTLHQNTPKYSCKKRVRVGEKRWKCPKILDLREAWLQIGCKNVLSICYQDDLNMYFRNAAEESAAFGF